MDTDTFLLLIAIFFAVTNCFFILRFRKIDRIEKKIDDALSEVNEISIRQISLENKRNYKSQKDLEHFDYILFEIKSLIDILIDIVKQYVESEHQDLIIKRLKNRNIEMITTIRKMELRSGDKERQRKALKYYASRKYNQELSGYVKDLRDTHQINKENIPLAQKILDKK